MKFTDCHNPSNIADILTSSGFPLIEVIQNNRQLAYECCLIHEVITKRIALLDDLRQRFTSERLTGFNLMNLASIHNEDRHLLFPKRKM